MTATGTLKNTLAALAFLAASPASFVNAQKPANAQQSNQSSQCCSIVSDALEAVGRIKKDMTRADVAKEFLQEGGLFSREQTVYTFKMCPYIKIRVTFSPDPNYKGFSDGSPRDVVRSVSKPFIEYGVSD
jgi:hypothetical protein